MYENNENIFVLNNNKVLITPNLEKILIFTITVFPMRPEVTSHVRQIQTFARVVLKFE